MHNLANFGTMGGKFKDLRQELDSLGYMQKLVPECVPLVEKLLLDLITTTSNLQKYMKISQQALEERDSLELVAEPYKCDNAKLIKECNDLHIAFIHFKEQHEKTQRELRLEISNLQMELDNCNLEKKKLMSQVQQLEKEKVYRGKKTKISRDLCASKDKKCVKTDMTNEEQITQLNKRLKDLEQTNLRAAEDIAILKNQLRTRDEEINRLHNLVEGGRPYNVVSKECCYKNIDNQLIVLQDEIKWLKRENNDLQMQIKDAVAKQHEAMRRALHLAERNRQLEKEMKDVDEIALAVEAECNNTVKDNTDKVARLQDRINDSLLLIQNLEGDNVKLKQAQFELSADLDAVKLEKMQLEKRLEKELEDKKRLTDRINSLAIMENDLNLEIDRLSKLSTEQKRRIAELESYSSDARKPHLKGISERSNLEHQATTKSSNNGEENNMLSQKVASTLGQLKSKQHKKTCRKASKSKSPTKSHSPTKLDEEKGDSAQKCCCETGVCIKNLKDLLDRELEYRQTHAKQSMEELRQEKDYFMKEYHRLLEQMRNIPNFEISEDGVAQLKQQLRDKENRIKQLEDEVNEISKRKLVASEMPGFSVTNGPCTSATCRNKARELDLKINELNHLEVENSALKSNLQAINETTVFNEERMRKAFKDMEEHIRKLEDERRDLVKAEVTYRLNISHLEEDYKRVKDQLSNVQIELNNQRANYNQLKLLHEQTDRALSEARSKTIRAETELARYKAQVQESGRNTAAQDNEIARLTSDIKILQNQLTKLDREKDDVLNKLDEKTEKTASLEDELNGKTKLISKLENELKELNRKLSHYASEASSQDQIVRTKQEELAMLEHDYGKERRLKEAALQENKRLQNDLSSVTCDCRNARNELEISRRQVEDLTRQLQQYVAEVKRTEDLISQKELERNELLDQFRSLSQEANILENNNQTLETEATQSKIQLSVALDHTSDLERKLENQESIIRSYEKQIADLTAHIARLEGHLKQNSLEREQYNKEIKQMRDLCVKLDKDKDSLKNELYTKEDWRAQVQKITDQLNEEKETLQKALERESSSLEAVEKLLNDTRREVTEQRLLNQDLQREVSRLKQNIAELEERLTTTAERLDNYQGKAFEYSQQNKQLRRDIANERFSRARFDSKGYYPSL